MSFVHYIVCFLESVIVWWKKTLHDHCEDSINKIMQDVLVWRNHHTLPCGGLVLCKHDTCHGGWWNSVSDCAVLCCRFDIKLKLMLVS